MDRPHTRRKKPKWNGVHKAESPECPFVSSGRLASGAIDPGTESIGKRMYAPMLVHLFHSTNYFDAPKCVASRPNTAPVYTSILAAVHSWRYFRNRMARTSFQKVTRITAKHVCTSATSFLACRCARNPEPLQLDPSHEGASLSSALCISSPLKDRCTIVAHGTQSLSS